MQESPLASQRLKPPCHGRGLHKPGTIVTSPARWRSPDGYAFRESPARRTPCSSRRRPCSAALSYSRWCCMQGCGSSDGCRALVGGHDHRAGLSAARRSDGSPTGGQCFCRGGDHDLFIGTPLSHNPHEQASLGLPAPRWPPADADPPHGAPGQTVRVNEIHGGACLVETGKEVGSRKADLSLRLPPLFPSMRFPSPGSSRSWVRRGHPADHAAIRALGHTR